MFEDKILDEILGLIQMIIPALNPQTGAAIMAQATAKITTIVAKRSLSKLEFLTKFSPDNILLKKVLDLDIKLPIEIPKEIPKIPLPTFVIPKIPKIPMQAVLEGNFKTILDLKNPPKIDISQINIDLNED